MLNENETRAVTPKEASYRAGRYQLQPGGYRAFIPATLPPIPPIQIAGDLQTALSRADLALGRLDGSNRRDAEFASGPVVG
jgi:hypothetical protein